MAFLGIKYKGIQISTNLGQDAVIPQAPGGGGEPTPISTYTAAAGITDETEINALNQLYSDLIGMGSTPNQTNVWNELKAFYPMSPTSIDAACYNLTDPSRLKLTPINNMGYTQQGFQGAASSWLDTAGTGDTGYSVDGFVPDNEFTSEINFTQFMHATYNATYSMGSYNGIGSSYYCQRMVNNGRTVYSGSPTGATVNTAQGTRVSVGVKNSTSVGGVQVYSTNSLGDIISAISTTSETALFPRFNAAVQNPSARMVVSGILNAQTEAVVSSSSLFKTAGWANALTANQAEDLIRAIENYNANVIVGGRN